MCIHEASIHYTIRNLDRENSSVFETIGGKVWYCFVTSSVYFTGVRFKQCLSHYSRSCKPTINKIHSSFYIGVTNTSFGRFCNVCFQLSLKAFVRSTPLEACCYNQWQLISESKGLGGN